MSKKPRKKSSSVIAKTLKAAIGITKLPLHVVQALKDAGSKAFNANGTVNLEILMEDAAKLPEADGTAPDYYVERAKDIRANRLLKEQKFDERARKLRPQEEVRRAVFRNVVACKQKLYAAESTISVEVGMRLGLTNEQLAQVKEIAARNIRQAIAELHGGELGKVECPECRKEIK